MGCFRVLYYVMGLELAIRVLRLTTPDAANVNSKIFMFSILTRFENMTINYCQPGTGNLNSYPSSVSLFCAQASFLQGLEGSWVSHQRVWNAKRFPPNSWESLGTSESLVSADLVTNSAIAKLLLQHYPQCIPLNYGTNLESFHSWYGLRCG